MTMKQIPRRIRRFLKADQGVSTLEYAMMVGLVATAVGAAIVTFSDDVQQAIANIGDQVDDVTITGVANPGADANAN